MTVSFLLFRDYSPWGCMELGNCITEEFAMHCSCIVKSTTSIVFLAVCFMLHHE